MSAADTIVIGGGVLGAAVTYYLSCEGVRVTLIDADLPGRATSASAGGLWPLGESLGLGCGVIFHAANPVTGSDVGPEPLPRVFMDLLVRSNAGFPTLASELRERSGIDIENEVGTGLLYVHYDEAQERHARSIFDYLGDTRGLAEWWTAAEVHQRDPMVSRDIRGAIHFPGDNQVNPMLLAEAFKQAAVNAGARFVSGTRVTGVRREGDRITAVETGREVWPCGAVVDAAGAWSAAIGSMAGLRLPVPVEPVRGQIVCTETLATVLRCNLSTVDCYILQKRHGEVIIGSTTERVGHDTAVRFADMKKLAAGGVRAVPALAVATIKRVWAGLRPGTPDELPILGANPELDNLFHATGGFRTGIVASALSAQMVASAVLGCESPYPLQPFLMARFSTVASLVKLA